ncbi:MAG: FtsQ-type POTRA domain-containing protein [Brooklawnia sp.]|nr:FtsQ-type POTRA domain-containing protein [Brooklawnia sp.]
MSVDLSARLDLRRRARRRSRWRRVLVGVGVLAGIVAAVWLVGFSSVLETRDVSVQGNELTSSEQVLDAAKVPLGTPLARLPGAAIRQRVLALPAVADVALHRKWPNSLVIEVFERELVYQRLDSGSYQWVDADGRVFRILPERAPGVVAVTSSNEQRMLADVATVVAALPPQVAEATERVEASTIDHIVVLLVDGRSIVWGNADKSDEKSAVLLALLDMPGTVLDVSVPSHPAIK